jgi:GWxTD domain-containing protein
MRTKPIILFFGRVVLALAITVCLFGSARALDGDLTVYAGSVCFDRPEFDSVALVEFPFTLERGEFEFFQPDSGGSVFFARIFAKVNLYGFDGLPVDSATTYFSAAVPDLPTAAQPGYRLFNSLALVVSPGTYSARVKIIDAKSKAEGEYFIDRVTVDAPAKSRLSVGGESLAHGIAYVGPEAQVVGAGVPRNGYEVLCNPLGVYSTRDSAAYLYAEVYNLDFDEAAPSEFTLTLSALDDRGEIYRELGQRTVQKRGSSAVVTESFDLAGWAPGEYTVRLTTADPQGGGEVAEDLRLSIVSQRAVVQEMAPIALEDPLDTLNLEVQLRLMHFLLTPDERASLETLSEIGKHSFVKQYWEERDFDPTTRRIENRLEMYERYLVSNNFFSSEEGKTDGWRSDRGRILMTYGAWERMDDAMHPVNGMPYQVWYYDSYREGAVFVFVDEDGFGEFGLVHSNMDGEIYSQDWEEWLRTGGPDLE